MTNDKSIGELSRAFIDMLAARSHPATIYIIPFSAEEWVDGAWSTMRRTLRNQPTNTKPFRDLICEHLLQFLAKPIDALSFDGEWNDLQSNASYGALVNFGASAEDCFNFSQIRFLRHQLRRTKSSEAIGRSLLVGLSDPDRSGRAHWVAAAFRVSRVYSMGRPYAENSATRREFSDVEQAPMP